MIRTSYSGSLIAAHPKRKDSTFSKSVIIIVDHDKDGAIGHRIDHKFQNGLNLETVTNNLGIPYAGDEPMYRGGPENVNRLIIVHTLDFHTKTTTKLTNDIGLTYDASILKAIAKGQGPRKFRAVAGYQRWLAGFLEGEITGYAPWNVEHTWIVTDPTEELVFDYEEQEQWRKVIETTGNLEINKWFSHVQG